MQKYKNRPLVIMGVNTDSKSLAAAIIKKNELPFNSWLDGPPTEAGPIQAAWQVKSFPTIFLIDSQGIIRCRNPLDLDGDIETLVQEAEKQNSTLSSLH